jgi:hypothetical protein
MVLSGDGDQLMTKLTDTQAVKGAFDAQIGDFKDAA